MKFLNNIDGASKILTDPSNRFVTDSEKAKWDGKADLPLVIGTQVSNTSAWTGAIDVDNLYNGLTIRYWLPRTSTSTSVTLNLNLRGGSTTGAIPCYYGGTSRLTTHYSGGSFIMMIYLENALINGTAYTGWWAKANYVDGTESYTIRWNTSVRAGQQITRYKLLMQGVDGRYYPTTVGDTTSGTKEINTVPFLIGSPILFYNYTSTIAENGLTASAYVYSGLTTSTTTYAWNQNSGWRANADVYFRGTVSGATFILDNSTLTSHMTQDLPTTEDGFYYMRLGMMTSTTTGFRLSNQHPIYYYANGELQSLNTSHGADWNEVLNKPTTFTPSAHNLSSHADVSTGAPSLGQVLKWNGSSWAPSTDNNTTYSNATTSTSGLMSNGDKTKLDGIESGATKNDTDANLKNRANHTGTQTSSTISNFAETVRSTVLTGLSTATNAVVAATDNVLTAIGKLQKQITDHIGSKSNPHSVTKSQVGLGNVDNTSDLAKPISTATQTALNGKVDNSRVLTDVPLNAKFTDTVYTHPTTSGNKHIPSGGSANQVLKYSADGTAVWSDAPAGVEIQNNLTTTVAGSALDATQGKALADLVSTISGVKTARFVVGTSTAGWTSADCDYLCDGTADDVEINAAITALPATGGEIVILDGTYNITAKIDVTKDNVSVRGNGNATILKRMFDSSVEEGLITLTSRSGCKIYNLQVDGNNAIYTNYINNGIYLFSSSNNTINGNTCNDNGNIGIYLSNSSNNTITGNTSNNNTTGIFLKTSSINTITGNNCYNNSFGIFLSGSISNAITGNTCFCGTGLPTDYTMGRNTIQIMGAGNNYNLISNNNCMGKAPTIDGGTGNSVYGNKYDSGDYKDFTQDEKTKLAGISDEANNYTHPTSHPASMITGLPNSLPADGGNADTVNGFTVGKNVPSDAKFTDTIVDISGKQDKLTAGNNIIITNNTISATDTKYTHPTNHPASMITQDASNRFVTDAQITEWNAKGTSNLTLGTTSSTAYRGDYGNTAYTHSQSTHAPTNAQANQTLTSGNGMTAWTATSGNLTVSLGTPSTLTTSSTNATTATSHTHSVTFPVTSVSGRTGAIVLTSSDVGLSNVENKSSGTIRGEITSSNVTTALGYTPLNSNLKGSANGLAELDSGGKVPSTQLPSYVDDVLEYAATTSFPTAGESGKIYVATDTNKTYRWTGTGYVEISASLALGETSATAYRGDRGKTAYDHSQLINGTNPHGTTFANIASKPTTLSGYGITDAAPSSHVGATGTAHGLATTSVNGFMSNTDKTKLDGIATGATANVGTVTSIEAGNGLKFTTITGSGSVTLGNPSTLTTSSTNSVTSTSHTHEVTFPVTSVAGKTGAVILDPVDIGAAASSHTHSYLPTAGGTMTGILYPQNNTSYTTGQARRIIMSTAAPSGGGNGDVWLLYV